MIQARASILVSRPREAVFAFIADPANDHQWRSHLVASRGRVGAVGDRITQTYSYEGKTQSMEFTVSEFEPPERLSYRFSGPLPVRLAFQCREEAGGTRVSMSFSATPTGIVSVLEGRITGEAARIAHADLDRLKRVLESVR